MSALLAQLYQLIVIGEETQKSTGPRFMQVKRKD